MAAGQEAVTAEERQAPRAGAQALGLLRRNDNQTLLTETTRVSEDTSLVRGQQFFSEVSHLKNKPWLFGPAWPQMHVLDWDHNHGNWNLPYFHQPFKNKSQPGLDFKSYSLRKKQWHVCLAPSSADCRIRMCQKFRVCFALKLLP